MMNRQATQTVVTSTQVKPPGTGAERGCRAQVLVFEFIGILLHERKCVLGESAGGRKQQTLVTRVLVEQAFHQLETEWHSRPDQLRIIVGSKRAAASSQRVTEFTDGHAPDRAATGQHGQG